MTFRRNHKKRFSWGQPRLIASPHHAMDGALGHLNIISRQLAEVISGIHQSLQAGGADHKATRRSHGFPNGSQDITQRTSDLQQHPIRSRRELDEIRWGLTSKDLEILDAKTGPIALKQFHSFRITLKSLHPPPRQQASDLKSQGTGTAAHIPDHRIASRPQIGQQDYPQLHRGGTESRSGLKKPIGQTRGHEIPLIWLLEGQCN